MNPEQETAPPTIFEDDDPGYEAWLAEHPAGWVVNATRNPKPAYLKLHRATCTTIAELRSGYSRWTTGEYIKICSERRADLERWASRSVGGDLQDGCHCVRFAARAAGRPAPPSQPPATTSPSARGLASAPDAEGFQVIDAPRLIPFEPKTDALLAAREQVRRVIGDLSAQPGELLHGIIEGSAASGTDLDNALLYNVGGRVAAATTHGVVLERRQGRGGTGARYRYRLTREPGLPCHAESEPVVELHDVQLTQPPTRWLHVWEAVRTSAGTKILRPAYTGELSLQLLVGAPHFSGAVNGEFVKALIDGVMTALHAHADVASAAEVSQRMGMLLSIAPANIEHLLLDDTRAALGTCERLVVLRSSGVQCHPEDHRLSAIRIEVDRTAPTWTLNGSVALAAEAPR